MGVRAGGPPAGLTPARRQVLWLLSAGLGDAALASLTGTSVRTVRGHVAAIQVALGARTRFAAAVEATRRGWLPPGGPAGLAGAAGAAGGGPPSPLQHRILLLLADGRRDQAVAASTGTSTRTVRRHIAALLRLLEADTRFAAAVEATRRGWLDAGRLPY